MKKRKPPIVLGALFVVLFGTVLGINAASLPPTQAEIEQHAKDEAAKHPRALPKRSKDADKYSRADAEGDAKFTNQKLLPGIQPGAPKFAPPIDYVAKQRKKLNPSDHLSAQGQWYAPESGVKEGN